MKEQNDKILRRVRSGKITIYGMTWHDGLLHAYNNKMVELRDANHENEYGLDIYNIRGKFICFIKTHDKR